MHKFKSSLDRIKSPIDKIKGVELLQDRDYTRNHRKKKGSVVHFFLWSHTRKYFFLLSLQIENFVDIMRNLHSLRILLWCVFTTALSVCMPTYATHYLYKQIKLNTGLPTTLNCIATDNRGFVWTGTKFGLGRFDGHEQKRYLHQENDKTSLPGNYVHQIVEDNLHRLWILTDQGVARYDYHTDTFIPVTDENGQPCVVRSACLRGDSLLLGGTNTVYLYHPNTDRLHVAYRLPLEEQADIFRLAISARGYLLCCSRWQGIYAINLADGRLLSAPLKGQKEIADMFIDSQQRIWLAPYNQGLRCFSPDGKELASYTTLNSDLSNNIVLCITEKEGKLWIATDGGGINILDVEKGYFTHLKHEPGDKLFSLPTNSINCMYRDHYGNIWLGGVYNGLICIREVSMKSYTDVPFGTPRGLSHNIVISLFQESPKKIWIGTDGGGLNLLNPETETFIHYPTTRQDKITSICDFTPGKLLFSIFAEGIYIFDIATGSKTPFQVIDQATTETLCHHGYSVYLYRNSPHTILLLSDHVYIYNLRTQQFSIANEEEPGTIVWGSLQAIASEDNHTFLFDAHRIYRLDHHTQQLHTLLTLQAEKTLNSVAYDKQGHFWMGTSEGLEQFVPATGQRKSVKTGLFTDVSIVVCRHADEIWIGAENMLFSYSPSKERFIIYDESDGVIPNEYVPRAQLVIPERGIYIGGVEGLLYITHEQQQPDEINYPELQLSDIILNGESIKEQMAKGQDALSVARNSNVVIQLMAKEEDIFRKRLYRYRIEGLDKNYIETYDHELSIRTQLPGTYRILASCTAKDGSWTEDRQILELTVLPLWYQTWWFALGCTLLGAIIVLEVFRKILKHKEQKLKWAMKEHEKQMYEEKVRFLINISHELRTPLTLICAPLKRILKSMEPNDHQYIPLQAIYRQAQRMKLLINMVLDARKMEMSETRLHLYPQPLNHWIKEVTQDFVAEAQAMHIIINYQLDPTINEVSFDSEKCEAVLSNLLVNALKHSPVNTMVTISSERPQKGWIRISVSDQGCGLNQVDMEKLFTRFYQGEKEQGGSGIGLSYAKILVEQHGGHIGACNNTFGGATFHFDLPERQTATEIINHPQAYLNKLLNSEGSVQPVEVDSKEEKEKQENIHEPSAYTILVVEDNPEMLDFLYKVLNEHFRQIITAKDGAEALKLTKERLPDLIVSDVMMPHINGYQLCKLLKEDISISHIPVILLTARSDEQSRQQGYKNGADAYLAKPFEEDTLLELIHNRLKERERIRQRYLQIGSIPMPEESTFSQADEDFLSRLNSLIQDNLDNCDLDVATLCRGMNMSRASLYNKLKILTNIGANEYVNKFRMEQAIRLISSTNIPMAEIATRVGFTTSSYFSTAFKQYTGEAPTQYKKRMHKQSTDFTTTFTS